MQSGLLTPDLLQFDMVVADQAELFAKMASKLVAAGYVRESFLDALTAREQKYPTALPTQPEAIAIPHTDPEHIIIPCIAPIRLQSSVRWAEMGNGENSHEVRFIFLLGLQKAGGQVQVLQALTTQCMDPKFFERMDSASSRDEFFDAIRSIEKFED